LLDKIPSITKKHVSVVLCCAFCVADEVLSASDELGELFDKYTAIILQRRGPASQLLSQVQHRYWALVLRVKRLPPVPVELLGNQLVGLGTGFF